VGIVANNANARIDVIIIVWNFWIHCIFRYECII